MSQRRDQIVVTKLDNQG